LVKNVSFLPVLQSFYRGKSKSYARISDRLIYLAVKIIQNANCQNWLVKTLGTCGNLKKVRGTADAAIGRSVYSEYYRRKWRWWGGGLTLIGFD
jgi:hypothetical protein